MANEQDARIAALHADIARLKAENEALAASKTPTTGPFVKLTDKGSVTFKPTDHFDAWPITLDLDQLEQVLAYMPTVAAFVATLDRSKCRTRDQRIAARKSKADGAK
jgi:hypothetical protein